MNVAICGRMRETLDEAVERVDENLGLVDVLVNNAGGSRSREDITGTVVEDFIATFHTLDVGSLCVEADVSTLAAVEALHKKVVINLFGGFQPMRLVIPHTRGQRWGRIINSASIWGREHAAVSLAKDRILVNSIAPGSISHPSGSWERFQR